MARSDNLQNRVGIGIGVTTLVTIFMVLLLTTFSVLTFASARYDWHLSTMAFDAIGAYYAADQEACQWVAEVRAVVEGQPAESWQSGIAGTSPDVSVSVIDLAAPAAAPDSPGHDPLDDASPVSGDSTPPAQPGIEARRLFRIDDRRFLEVRLTITTDGRVDVTEWVAKTVAP